MDRSMHAEVAAGKLPDLTVFTTPARARRTQLAALAALPNVRAVEPRSCFDGRVYIGARRAPVSVVGVRGLRRAARRRRSRRVGLAAAARARS